MRPQQVRVAQGLAEAGFPRELVDGVVLSHIEGVGMVAWRDEAGAWSPFFPTAQILVSDVALQEFETGLAQRDSDLETDAWTALIAQGKVSRFVDGEAIAPGLRAEVSGGHSPGHSLFHFGGDGFEPGI